MAIIKQAQPISLLLEKSPHKSALTIALECKKPKSALKKTYDDLLLPENIHALTDSRLAQKLKKATEVSFEMLDDDRKAQHKLHQFSKRYFANMSHQKWMPVMVDMDHAIKFCVLRLHQLMASKPDTKQPFFKAQIANMLRILKGQCAQIHNLISRYQAINKAKTVIKTHCKTYHYRTQAIILPMLDKLHDAEATKHANQARYQATEVTTLMLREVEQTILEAESVLIEQIGHPKSYTRMLSAILPVCGITPYQACCASKVEALSSHEIEVTMQGHIYTTHSLINAKLIVSAIHAVQAMKDFKGFKDYAAFTKKHGSAIAASATGKRKNPMYTLSKSHNTTIEFWRNVYKARLLLYFMQGQKRSESDAYCKIADNIGQNIPYYQANPIQGQLTRFIKSFGIVISHVNADPKNQSIT